ncbi:hypothetical protein BKA69DRAFT_1076785 [Paraphysoderma sedebokerense]|nr:hypothetical protein BKA69DRAFT_1076785 [Paraphysoderma sedebokerense]
MFTSTFYAAAAVCFVLTLLARHLSSSSAAATAAKSASKSPKSKSSSSSAPDASFKSFQRNYWIVFWLMNGADWLYGPYLYSIYREYGLELDMISWLSVVGFLSSAILGTIAGTLSDKLGRKKMCLCYTVTFACSCVCLMFNDIKILTIGRVFGGVSTSLLFSAFESWMVSEHFSRGFDGKDLSSTFSTAFFGNSIIAVLAGLYANAVVEKTGNNLAPFYSALVPIFIGALLILFSWTENYGGKSTNTKEEKKKSQIGLPIYLIGIIQACYESAMYGFVFLFAPAMDDLAAVTKTALPFGMIFATFMVHSMIGSQLCSISTTRNWSVEAIATPTFLVASASLALASQSKDLSTIFYSFNAFETTVGLFFPLISSLRTKYVPESVRATVMSLFRVPLNLIVVGMLYKVSYSPASTSSILLFASGLCCVALVSTILLKIVSPSSPVEVKKKK